MGRITSSIGLVTGVPIEDTVNQLMALNARPRDLITNRNAALRQEQLAVNTLLASTVGVQLAARNLNDVALFTQRTVSSSDTTLLTATSTGTPASGNYEFTPIRRAQSHQLLSSGFASKTQAIGSGKFSFSFGGFVDRGVDLADLNGGSGVARGSIEITDRSGESATIDLGFARTVDDVLDAINGASGVSVRAETYGDSIRLIDESGSTTSNLRVDEVGLGNTAADLGLDGINIATDSAVGADVVRLTESTLLQDLNNGAGLSLRGGLADLELEFRDGSAALQIDFGDFSQVAANSAGTTAAANGTDAQITITADTTGGDYDDYELKFVSSGSVTQGNETVAFDSSAKTITVDIESGTTTASDVASALNGNSTFAAAFTGAANGTGAGVVNVSDTASTSGGAELAAPEHPTLSDLLRVLNAADPTRLQAQLSADGDKLELTDLTSGAGDFGVSSPFDGSVAEDLGLVQTTTGDTLSSQRLIAGLKTSLLSSLAGGVGLGTLGTIQVTDRAGGTSAIDLSSAETLDDVIQAINAGGASVEARINDARNGIEIKDTSGGTANLTVADADATNSATLLGISSGVASDSIDGGTLNLQTVGESKLLSDFRGGISEGSFTISNSLGQSGAISFRQLKPKTLGDVIDAINALDLNVTAGISADGSGLALTDSAGGSSIVKVSEVGNSTTAADLGLTGTAVTQTVSGQSVQVLTGSSQYAINISSSDKLEDIVTRINDLDAGVTAAIFNEGFGGNPFRLSLTSNTSGRDGELLVDTSNAGFQFDETAAAEDALLLVGSQESGILATSTTNSFDGVLTDVTLNIAGASTDPVSISVRDTQNKLKTNVRLFVSQYNALVDKLDELTFFNPESESSGVLFGTSTALRVQSGLGRALTNRYRLSGTVDSLAQIGVSLDDTGQLSFTESKLDAALASDPDGLKEFFTDQKGFAQTVDTVLEGLAGIDNSVLTSRTESLQRRIDLNDRRIGEISIRLDSQRERLLVQFYRMELVISRLQTGLSSVQSIAPIPIIGS
jgi:flagellar capping protein FliD